MRCWQQKIVIERPISITHLTPPPFTITIQHREVSRVTAPGLPPEWRKRPWPVCPPCLTVPTKLGYQMDIDGQTLPDCGLPCAGDSCADFLDWEEHLIARYLSVDTG